MDSINYTKEELKLLCESVGDNVTIHRSVVIFGKALRIGSNVRIDCHSMISTSAPVEIGSNVHIAAGVYIYGAYGVVLSDYVGLSARCTLFTATDDYTGGHLTNPTVPEKYRKIMSGPICLEKHALIGCGSIIMPGVTIGRGASIGAQSFVNKSVPPYVVAMGSPLRKITMRNEILLNELETKYENEKSNY
jgi:dTDP-4-amino-4,6-dideoxy-D-glucose acyltransferase